MNAKLLLLASAAFAMATASAEVTVRTVNEKDGTPYTATYISNGRIRMEATHGEGSLVLWKAGTRTVTEVNTAKKTYMILDVDQVTAQMKKAAEQMKQYEAQMASMPPQVRQMMQGKIPGMGGKPLVDMKITKTGKSASKGGYTCQMVDLAITGIPMAGEMGQEMCVTDPNKLGVPAADLDTIKQLATMMQDMTKAMGGMGVSIPDFNEVGGWPVWSRDKHSGDVSVLKTISKGGVDAALFEIPAGYTEEKMPSMDGEQPAGGKKKKKKSG